MTTAADFVQPLTSNLRKLSAGQWREGDVVFYFAPGKGEVHAQAGYTVLASATERYLFDPYKENSRPHRAPMPANVQMWYHSTVPINPKDLHLEDVLALLWSTHRKGAVGKEDQVIEHEAFAIIEGEVLLQDRLEGYLSLNVHGQEQPYAEPKSVKKNRLLPAKKPKLIERPFTQRSLLRLVATDPKRIRFFSR